MTSIEWVTLDGAPGLTVNPIKAHDRRHPKRVGHFCEKVSEGCKNCYASTWQRRLRMFPYEQQHRDRIAFFLDEHALRSIIRRRKPTAFFWEDMSDLFGRWVPDRWLDACFLTMAATPRHLHMVLTKRPDRMREYFAGLAALDDGTRLYRMQANAQRHVVSGPESRALDKALAQVHPAEVALPFNRVRLGVSYEDQATANLRLPKLLLTPAWQRFVSFEPALGAVTIRWAACTCADKAAAFKTSHETTCPLWRHELVSLLHRVIVGGESGHGARPFYLQWARSTIRQCHELRVPVFVKQIGSLPTLTPVGTEHFERFPTQIVKLAMTPAAGRKRPAFKGNDPAEWPEEFRVRE